MFRHARSIEQFFERRPWLGLFCVFAVAAAVFAYIQFQPSFRDPDSFYHAKMAQLIMERGAFRDFGWLPYTTLADAYADHHFLYHLALIPFIALLGPFVGTKVAAAVLAAAAIAAFYWLLRALNARFASLFALALLFSNGFIFRLNLAKTSSVSLIFLLGAMTLVARRRVWPIFFLAFAYVWAYGGWPIMLVIVGAAMVGKAVADHITTQHPMHSWAHLWHWRRLLRRSHHAWAAFLSSIEIRQFAAVSCGIVAGLVINPYFPNNFSFYWRQIIEIAVVNDLSRVGAGAEWYPLSFASLLGEAGIIFVMLGAAIAAFLVAALLGVKPRRHDDDVKMLATGFVLASLFFLLTLRSHRHVEYFVPFCMIFLALLWNAFFRRVRLQEAFDSFATSLGRAGAVAATAVLVVAVLVLGGRSIIGTRRLYDDGIHWKKYARATAWLRVNAANDAVVFHSDWDDFPMLFFYNDSARYIAGLDPRFFASKDGQKYRQWVDITTGRRRSGVRDTVVKGFGASYVLIENDHASMRGAVEADGGFDLAYADDEVRIYAAR